MVPDMSGACPAMSLPPACPGRTTAPRSRAAGVTLAEVSPHMNRPSTPAETTALPLNGIDGSTGTYLVPSVSAAEIAALARSGGIGAAELRDVRDKIGQPGDMP